MGHHHHLHHHGKSGGGEEEEMMMIVGGGGGGGGGGISPKSVISDVRFVSPGSSSSSSSMEHGGLVTMVMGVGAATAATAVRRDGCQWSLPLPPALGHDRGYSISDGEISDSDSSSTNNSTTFLDSIAAVAAAAAASSSSSSSSSSSRELAKIGYLESLPETHSLALDTVRPTPTSSSGAAAAAEGRIASSSSPGKEERGSSHSRKEGTDGSSSSALQGGPPPSSTTPVHVNQYKEVVQEDLGKKLLSEVVGMQHGAENNTSCSINNKLAAEEEEPPPLQTPLPNKVAELEEEEGKQQQHWLSTNAAAAAAATTAAAPLLITTSSNDAFIMKDLPMQTAAANVVAEIDEQASTQSSNEWASAAAASSDDCCSAELLNREPKVQYLRRSQQHLQGVNEAHTKLQGCKRISAAAAIDTTAATSSSTVMEKAENVKTQHTSASMGIFAYPRTPQRIFPGLQAFTGSPPVAGHVPVAAAASLRASNGNGFYSTVSSSSSSAEKATGKGPRHVQQRFYSGPLLNPIISKPTPSKWDDAEKWITSPGHQESPAHPQLQHAPVLVCSQPGRRHSIAGAQGLQSYEGAGSPEYSTTSNAEKILSPRNVEPIGIYKGHQRQVPSVVTTQKKRSKTLSFGDLSKQFDDHLSQAAAAGKFDSQPGEVLFEGDRQAVAEMAKVSIAAQSSTSFRMNQAAAAIGGSPNLPHQLPQSVEENWSAKQHAFGIIKEPESLVPSSPDDPCTKDEFSGSVDLLIPTHCRSVSMKEIGTDPPTPPTSHTPQPSLGHRDMATQMTPVESLKNSMCTTPKLATSPTRNNTPACSGTPSSVSLGLMVPGFDFLELKSCHLAKLELCKLGCHNEQPMLNRNAVLNLQQDDESEHGASVHQYNLRDMEKGNTVSKATVWEQLELTKCTRRYNDKEAKILAWEVLEKSKAEAELKKTEVKLEKMRVRAIEKMQKRVATVCQKSEEMRAAAKHIRNEKAAKTTARAQQIIGTGQLPPSQKSFRCCFS
ncbi:hypothetical protein CY35_03G021600 [Sphagnum magellanicum]|nr:hypothetical protein CY35_03G021600 [Sphagnum magellanicum]